MVTVVSLEEAPCSWSPGLLCQSPVSELSCRTPGRSSDITEQVHSLVPGDLQRQVVLAFE